MGRKFLAKRTSLERLSSEQERTSLRETYLHMSPMIIPDKAKPLYNSHHRGMKNWPL